MPELRRCIPLLALVALAACDSSDHTRDIGLDSHPLSELQAGIWIDPNGCHHWIVDDGVEGYMSQRLDPYGHPVCSDLDEPGTAIWDYKSGSPVSDTLF